VNPQSSLHLDAAARNQTIASQLLYQVHLDIEPVPDDWAITVLFYSALHLVDAYLLEVHGTKPSNHTDRNRSVQTEQILNIVSEEYASLYAMSRTARYRPLATFPPNAVQQAFDQLDVIQLTITDALPTT
jgi:hypothetical protein